MAQHYFCFKPNPNFCFKLIVFLAAACPHCLCFHGTAPRAFTIFCRLCVCNLFIFTVFFVSVRTDIIVHVMLHCNRVCCPGWLLIYLLNLLKGGGSPNESKYSYVPFLERQQHTNEFPNFQNHPS